MGKIYNFFPFGITRNTSHNFSKLSSGVFMSSAMQNPLRLSILNWMLANIVDMNSMHIIHVLGLQWTNSNLFIFIKFECLKFLFDTMIDVCIKLALYIFFPSFFPLSNMKNNRKGMQMLENWRNWWETFYNLTSSTSHASTLALTFSVVCQTHSWKVMYPHSDHWYYN